MRRWREESSRSHVLNLTLLEKLGSRVTPTFSVQSADLLSAKSASSASHKSCRNEWPDASIQDGHNDPSRDEGF